MGCPVESSPQGSAGTRRRRVPALPPAREARWLWSGVGASGSDTLVRPPFGDRLMQLDVERPPAQVCSLHSESQRCALARVRDSRVGTSPSFPSVPPFCPQPLPLPGPTEMALMGSPCFAVGLTRLACLGVVPPVHH